MRVSMRRQTNLRMLILQLVCLFSEYARAAVGHPSTVCMHLYWPIGGTISTRKAVFYFLAPKAQFLLNEVYRLTRTTRAEFETLAQDRRRFHLFVER